jgi:acetyl esterase
MALDREVQMFLAAAAEAGQPPLHTLTPAEARKQSSQIRELIGDGPEVDVVTELTIPVTGAEIAARLYEPAGADATIVWLHGGGWVIADLESHDAMCRLLANHSGCAVVSVDYRLAPEHPFPTPLDDCWEALQWVSRERGDAPLIVGGDSAGGNMAAVCAVRARDRGGPALALQVLIYPVTDLDLQTASYREFGGGDYFLSSAEMAWFADHYVPDPARRADPEVSPLRTLNLAGVAPAIVLTAEYDPLRDEGLAYAARLREAGVPVTVHEYDGMIHAFFSFVSIFERGNEAVAEVAGDIRAALSTITA